MGGSAAKESDPGAVVEELLLRDRYGETLLHRAVNKTSHAVVAELMSVLLSVEEPEVVNLRKLVMNMKTSRQGKLCSSMSPNR